MLCPPATRCYRLAYNSQSCLLQVLTGYEGDVLTRSAIEQQLATYMNKPPECQTEVVYVFVKIRKFLEHSLLMDKLWTSSNNSGQRLTVCSYWESAVFWVAKRLGPLLAPDSWESFRNRLRYMVGTRRLELLTSTVSR